MEIRTWFERAYKADDRINELVRVRQELYHQALRVTPAYSGGDRVQSSPAGARDDLYARIADQEARINAKIDELVMIKAQILDVCNQMDRNPLASLLMKRHLRFQSWRKIAISLGKSEEHVRGPMYRQALAEAEPYARKYLDAAGN